MALCFLPKWWLGFRDKCLDREKEREVEKEKECRRKPWKYNSGFCLSK